MAALQATLRRVAAELLELAGQARPTPAADGGAKTHVLIDWENVQPSEAECRALVPGATDVWLFHGPNQKNVIEGYPSFGARATEIRIARSGKNALDFHLSFYVGYLASQSPGARLVVLSNDKGYGSMLEHAEVLGFAASQLGVKRVAKRRAPAKKAPAKRAARPTLPVAEKAVAGASAPARQPAAKKRAAAKRTPAKQVVAERASVKEARATKARPTAGKSLEQLVDLLRKSPAANRPRKRARLLAFVASRIGNDVDAAEAMLARLAADGRIAIDAKGTVGYRL